MATRQAVITRSARLAGCSVAEVAARRDAGERWCNKGRHWRRVDTDFHKGKSWCKSCVADHNGTVLQQRNHTQARYAQRHPDRIKARNDRYRGSSTKVADYMRAYSLRTLYGITVERYNELLVLQNGGCAICGRRQSDSKGRRLCVDHCHRTGKVRGLLCRSCNMLVGAFEKDIERMRAGVGYLRIALEDLEAFLASEGVV